MVSEVICGRSERPLARSIGFGMLWSSGSYGVVQVLTVLRGIILARILVPEDFGLYALANSFIGLVATLGNVGIGQYVIYRRDDSESNSSTSFWVNALLGACITSMMMGVAPFVSAFYGRPELTWMIVGLACGFLLQFVCTIHVSLLRKSLRFGALSLIAVIINIALFGLTVGLALSGYRAWSFIVAAIGSNLLNLLLLLGVSRWLPGLKIRGEVWREIFRFGLAYVGAALIWFALFNVDNFVISKSLGMHALGIYALAYNYAMLPSMAVYSVTGGISSPVLASLRGDKPRLQSFFLKINKCMAVTSCAIGIFLVISAPELFRLGLGGKWDEAVLPFRVLVVYGITRSLYPDVLVPLGRASVSLWLGLLVVPFVVAGVLVGLRYGLPGVAVGVSATLGVSPILFIPFIAREAGFDCKTVLGTNLVILLSCGLTLGAGLSAQGYSQGVGGGLTHAVAIGLLSCLTFIGVVLVLVPSLKEDLRGILSSMTLRRGVPALSEGSD